METKAHHRAIAENQNCFGGLRKRFALVAPCYGTRAVHGDGDFQGNRLRPRWGITGDAARTSGRRTFGVGDRRENLATFTTGGHWGTLVRGRLPAGPTNGVRARNQRYVLIQESLLAIVPTY